MSPLKYHLLKAVYEWVIMGGFYTKWFKTYLISTEKLNLIMIAHWCCYFLTTQSEISHLTSFRRMAPSSMITSAVIIIIINERFFFFCFSFHVTQQQQRQQQQTQGIRFAENYFCIQWNFRWQISISFKYVAPFDIFLFLSLFPRNCLPWNWEREAKKKELWLIYRSYYCWWLNRVEKQINRPIYVDICFNRWLVNKNENENTSRFFQFFCFFVWIAARNVMWTWKFRCCIFHSWPN